MKKFASIILVTVVAVIAATSQGEAGWKKRGWYQKRPGANCVVRKVVASGTNGNIVISKVRVCR